MKSPRESRLFKWLKRIAFVAVALITLTVLVVVIEGYRAKRAWNACKQELEANGEKLDWPDLAPSPVPADENFLATPALAPCFGFDINSAKSGPDYADTNACHELQQRLAWAGHLPGPGDWRKAAVIDLARWQTELRATDAGNKATDGGDRAREMAKRYGLPESAIRSAGAADQAPGSPAWTALLDRPAGTPLEDLRFLLDYDKQTLDEIRDATRRPACQLSPNVALDPEALLPQLARLKSLVYPFRASCWTELVAGNPAAALTDFETMLALSRAAGSQPLLIGMLVQIATAEIAIGPLWAGLAEHRWSEAELVRLEELLREQNMVAEMQRGLRGERAFALAMLGWPSGNEDKRDSSEMKAMRAAVRWWPAAVIYRNRINIVRAYQEVLLARLNPAGPSVRVQPTAADQAVRERFGRHSPYNIFTPMLLKAIEKGLEKAARSQATVTLARVACALERHRLAKASYPESLEQLSPGFLDRLPPDPINGGRLKYRREAPDRFVLYSVGLDGRDDGGVISAPDSEKAKEAKDIVWQSHPSPATAPQP
ncbi:MAG TPA: hypothetical protein PK640_06210 [Verrucomicrobiota bacterium]|nr:hypothetical protein [Verrucomicrobiota bacterium]